MRRPEKGGIRYRPEHLERRRAYREAVGTGTDVLCNCAEENTEGAAGGRGQGMHDLDLASVDAAVAAPLRP